MSHTSGPWKTNGRAIETDTKRATLVAVAEDNGPTESEASANARLIAAAPELLEALMEIVDGEENGYPNGQFGRARTIAKASAAITKARGTK